MKKSIASSIKVILLTFAYSGHLYAHRPLFTDDPAKSPQTAVLIKEPEISQVVYRQITQQNPQIWLTFEAPADFELFIQLGVPVISRQKDFRPAMALIGPGLPENDPPFKIPSGLGAKIFRTDDISEPRFFHEEFTKTDSWILRTEILTLNNPGKYYLVAFAPDNTYGKVWLAIGEKESFLPEHWAKFPVWTKIIRDFHEVKNESQTTMDAGVSNNLPNNNLPDLLETARAAGKFNTLIAAIEAAGLVEAMKSPGPLTVFAPTDAAFEKLPKKTLEELLKPQNREKLQNILKYHVIPGKINIRVQKHETLNKEILILNTLGTRLANDSKIIASDIPARNGIIHVIDTVLIPGEDNEKKAAVKMIESAIELGVPLFNNSRPDACAAVYKSVLLNLKDLPPGIISADSKAKIENTILRANSTKDDRQKAWTFRYLIDDIRSELKFETKTAMESPVEFLLIDDFSKEGGVSALGSKWSITTDQVMGGISTANYSFDLIDGRRCIRLTGDVSLENNGGFIQVALPLGGIFKSFDAGSYKGIRLWTKGNGRSYYLHLKTNQTTLPWQYYWADFKADRDWKMVELPFEDFAGDNIQSKLNSKQLKRLAIVGAKKAFNADVAVARIEFYK
jgi:uncharacterized surface protein with fasciclin (FAS1) repeats